MHRSWLIGGCAALLAAAACAQEAGVPAKPQDTEQWTPVPAVVTPGAATAPPSDAIVLFNGKDLGEWVSTKDKSPAAWTVEDGVMTVKKIAGNIETKRSFRNYQLHLEYRIPSGISGSGQGRGNSGVFLASTGAGDGGYELQILDSYKNETYVNGQAGSLYKQHPPLVNASRPPGEWQTYDVIWTAPVFAADGSVTAPAKVTALPQRRADPERRHPGRRDPLHRQTEVPALHHRADQAAGARRSQPADQLPQHLGARAAVAAMRRAVLTAALAAALLAGTARAAPPSVELWRLDCGELWEGNLDEFSDTHAYVGKAKRLVVSCYLIRHGETYMLWDAGLPRSDLGKALVRNDSESEALRVTLVDQLAQIGVKPRQVSVIGISHYHFDHTGQASDFPQAKLLMGKPDVARLRRPGSTLAKAIEPCSPAERRWRRSRATRTCSATARCRC